MGSEDGDNKKEVDGVEDEKEQADGNVEIENESGSNSGMRGDYVDDLKVFRGEDVVDNDTESEPVEDGRGR